MNMAVKKIVNLTLMVSLAFIAIYVPMFFLFGYSYTLLVVSVIVFLSLSLLVTLVFFKGRQRVKAVSIGSPNRIKALFAAMIALAAAEELLLNSVFALYGFALSFFGLVSTPVLAVVLDKSDSSLRRALEAVALVFATRVVLSPFSVSGLDLPVFVPTIYTLILLALVLYMTYRKIPAGEVRIRLNRLKSLPSQVCVSLGVGVAIGLVEYFVLRPQPVMTNASVVQMLLYIVLVLCVMVGVAEEVLFRGLLQSPLEKVMPSWQAIGVASVLFGLMHVGWMNPLEVLFAYGAGVVFGYMAVATDSLMAPIIAHGVGNLSLYMFAML
jgi:hypothetical protein